MIKSQLRHTELDSVSSKINDLWIPACAGMTFFRSYYKFGDVVLIGFPFTNLQTTKKRPAVVISNAAYQQERPDIILMAITSQVRQPLTIGEALIQD